MALRSVARLLLLSLILTLLYPTLNGMTPSKAWAATPGQPVWVEDLSRRTPHARFFQSGNTMRAELSPLAATHVQDDRGQWVAPPRRLEADPAGGFKANVGAAKIQFSGKSQGNSVEIDLGSGGYIKMGLDEETALLDTSGKTMPRGDFRVSAVGDTVRYKDKTGRIDYEYELTSDGLKETIVLHQGTEKNEFYLPIETAGLDVRDHGGGLISLIDRQGNPRAVINPTFAFDAAGNHAPPNRHAVQFTEAGAVLWVSVNREWLEAKDRKFPVYIDPTVVIVPEGAGLHAATIYSTAGQATAAGILSLGYGNHGLIKFDLSGIPKGSHVLEARLEIPPTQQGGTMKVHEILTEWFPNAVSWLSPRGQGTSWAAGGDAATTSLGNLAAGPVNISSLVQSWVHGTKPNFGVQLRREVSLTATITPTLQVTYSLDVLPPTVTVETAGNLTAVASAFSVSATHTDTVPGGVSLVELLIDGSPAQVSRYPASDRTQFTVDPRVIGNGTHSLSVRAFDYAGNQKSTTPLAFTVTVPEPPRNLAVSGTLLTWEPPAAGSGFTYNVYRSTDPSDLFGGVKIGANLTATTFTDSSLPASKPEAVYYGVTAVSGGESSASRAVAEYAFAPSQPQVIKDKDNSYLLSWPPSPRPGVTYNVYRGEYSSFTLSPSNRVGANLTTPLYRDIKNRLRDGSFEATTNAPWYYGLYPNSMVRDTTVAKFGTSSAKMWQNANTYSTQVDQTTDYYALTGPITVSAWSKASSVTGTPDGGYALEARSLSG